MWVALAHREQVVKSLDGIHPSSSATMRLRAPLREIWNETRQSVVFHILTVKR
jgi:hypothetical protein